MLITDLVYIIIICFNFVANDDISSSIRILHKGSTESRKCKLKIMQTDRKFNLASRKERLSL